jgi:DNA-binding transcriptional LysR family regulator
VPEVGLELHSNPCEHWELPETCGIRASPADVRPSPKLRVWTLSTLFPPRMQTPVEDPVHLGQYADAVWISSVIPEGFQALTELACRLAGFEPSIKFRADTYDTILDFVAADFGPALVPAIAARPRAGVQYRDISYPPDLKRLTHLTVRDTWNSPAMDAMIDILHRRLKQLPRLRPALKSHQP